MGARRNKVGESKGVTLAREFVESCMEAGLLDPHEMAERGRIQFTRGELAEIGSAFLDEAIRLTQRRHYRRFNTERQPSSAKWDRASGAWRVYELVINLGEGQWIELGDMAPQEHVIKAEIYEEQADYLAAKAAGHRRVAAYMKRRGLKTTKQIEPDKFMELFKGENGHLEVAA